MGVSVGRASPPVRENLNSLRGIYETTVQLDRETVPKGQQDSDDMSRQQTALAVNCRLI